MASIVVGKKTRKSGWRSAANATALIGAVAALGGGYGLGALGQFSSGECEWISKPIVEPRTVTNLPGLCKPSDELTVGTLPRRIDRWWKADRPNRQAASNRPYAEVGSSAWLQCMAEMYAD